MTSEKEQHQTGGVPREQAVASSSPAHEAPGASGEQAKQPSFFYTQEPEEDSPLPRVDDPPHEQDGLSSPFVLPFQNSAAMQTLPKVEATGAQAAMGSSPAASRKTQRGSFSLLKMALLLGVALVTVLGASLVVFAQPATPPATTTAKHPMQGGDPAPQTPLPAHTTPKATGSPPERPTTPPNRGQGTPEASAPSMGDVPSAQLLDQLGWTNAGFTLGDAIEVLRTGTTFTDREMSYDYRNIGTLANHSGTLTGSNFLLTPGGQVRFANNDVRVINNVLYEKIRAGKRIQQVVSAHASLVQLQVTSIQGQQRQFVWVSVSFALLQSRIDPASGKRIEGLENDPKTGQPLLHHMAVLLLRVPLQDQGANAPMGGTGWLVNTYALDMQGLPGIATDPAL